MNTGLAHSQRRRWVRFWGGRLRHNVIKTGVRMISLSYSRISLADMATKLHLDSVEDAEYIVAKVGLKAWSLGLGVGLGARGSGWARGGVVFGLGARLRLRHRMRSFGTGRLTPCNRGAIVGGQAIRDGVIEASLDHAHGYMQSKETVDVYATKEPQLAFHQRIEFCLGLHNESVKVRTTRPAASAGCRLVGT